MEQNTEESFLKRTELVMFLNYFVEELGQKDLAQWVGNI